MSKLKAVRDAVGVLEKSAVNPFFKSKYIDINGLLDVLNPALNEQGLTLLQPLSNVAGRPAVRTIIKDGDNVLIDDAVALPDLQDPQKMGACITYYRRYALISLFALQAEDDDGNMASGKTETQNFSSKKLKPLHETTPPESPYPPFAESVKPVPPNKLPH